MARPIKAGLQYFPFDVDFFSDDKIELISSEYGIKGEVVAIRLLCLIYRNGYYYQWGEDESLLFAKRVGNGITGSLVNEVVTGLVKRSFFDKGVFDSFQILTSRGIQKRYADAKERSKEVTLIEEITLIDVIDAFNGVNVTFTSINAYKSTQSKVKESKVKESKEDAAAINEALTFPFSSEKFKTAWEEWKQFKKQEHRFNYKSEKSEQAALNELAELSKKDEAVALCIINKSIANGWKGFFTLKNDLNGKHSGNNEKSTAGKQLIGENGFGRL